MHSTDDVEILDDEQQLRSVSHDPPIVFHSRLLTFSQTPVRPYSALYCSSYDDCSTSADRNDGGETLPGSSAQIAIEKEADPLFLEMLQHLLYDQDVKRAGILVEEQGISLHLRTCLVHQCLRSVVRWLHYLSVTEAPPSPGYLFPTPTPHNGERSTCEGKEGNGLTGESVSSMQGVGNLTVSDMVDEAIRVIEGEYLQRCERGRDTFLRSLQAQFEGHLADIVAYMEGLSERTSRSVMEEVVRGWSEQLNEQVHQLYNSVARTSTSHESIPSVFRSYGCASTTVSLSQDAPCSNGNDDNTTPESAVRTQRAVSTSIASVVGSKRDIGTCDNLEVLKICDELDSFDGLSLSRKQIDSQSESPPLVVLEPPCPTATFASKHHPPPSSSPIELSLISSRLGEDSAAPSMSLSLTGSTNPSPAKSLRNERSQTNQRVETDIVLKAKGTHADESQNATRSLVSDSPVESLSTNRLDELDLPLSRSYRGSTTPFQSPPMVQHITSVSRTEARSTSRSYGLGSQPISEASSTPPRGRQRYLQVYTQGNREQKSLQIPTIQRNVDPKRRVAQPPHGTPGSRCGSLTKLLQFKQPSLAIKNMLQEVAHLLDFPDIATMRVHARDAERRLYLFSACSVMHPTRALSRLNVFFTTTNYFPIVDACPEARHIYEWVRDVALRLQILSAESMKQY